MSAPENPPAFSRNGDHCSSHDGMSLRDYFAAEALAQIAPHDRAGRSDEELAALYAHTAYRLADAMLEERSKP